jgi:hypothetical protein
MEERRKQAYQEQEKLMKQDMEDYYINRFKQIKKENRNTHPKSIVDFQAQYNTNMNKLVKLNPKTFTPMKVYSSYRFRLGYPTE